MNRIVILFFGCILSIPVFAQRDPAALHAIIKSHMSNSDVYVDRKNTEISRFVLAERVKSVTNKYAEVEKAIKKRISTGYYTLEFGYQITQIMTEIKKTPQLVSEYSSFAIQNGKKHPLILKYYYASIEGIKEEIEYTKKILAGGVLIRNNKKAKHNTLIHIENSISNINRLLSNALFMSKGVVGLDLTYKESFIELMESKAKKQREKIKNDIISNMDKEK